MRRWLPFAALVAALAGYAVAGGNGVGSGGLNGFPASGSSSGGSVSFNTVTASFIDAGTIGVANLVNPAAVGININPGSGQSVTNTTRNWGAAGAADVWVGGVRIPTNKALYLNTGETAGLTSDNATISVFGLPLILPLAANAGTCTLDGASPSKCTATVRAGSVCSCSLKGTAAPTACGWNLVTTTATFYGANGLTSVVGYFCFAPS